MNPGQPEQPGYDALAGLYAQTFPDPFQTALERRAVDAFADMVIEAADSAAAVEGTAAVVDVGCGTGETAAYLACRGLVVRGVEPSAGMLAIARANHPHLNLTPGDAQLEDVDLSSVRGIIARHSLIHVPPPEVRTVLADWHARLPAGAVVLLSAQSSDEAGVHEFDHLVAQAWRWHPDALAESVSGAGFDEVWRTVSRIDADHRFPEVHLAARVSSPHPA
ncbi:class I SAM-dependent methyltransferase [Gordonia sp. (in: high G+C Gram-positive bacteria)]|uniref:class I SAM-dependent methyltransferase n=1 Tax=Gordonia sp. (in: high G+C Gram-positive bacteria) TaxID=84139 RepID=UPI003C751A99